MNPKKKKKILFRFVKPKRKQHFHALKIQRIPSPTTVIVKYGKIIIFIAKPGDPGQWSPIIIAGKKLFLYIYNFLNFSHVIFS